MYAEMKAFWVSNILDFRSLWWNREYHALAANFTAAAFRVLAQALVECRQAPIHDAMRLLLSEDSIKALTLYCLSTVKPKGKVTQIDEVSSSVYRVYERSEKVLNTENDVEALGRYSRKMLKHLQLSGKSCNPFERQRSKIKERLGKRIP